MHVKFFNMNQNDNYINRKKVIFLGSKKNLSQIPSKNYFCYVYRLRKIFASSDKKLSTSDPDICVVVR